MVPRLFDEELRAMGDTPETSADMTPRVGREYEDPHYHDEEEVAPPTDDSYARHLQPPARRNLSRLPPRRRFVDD
jgi:hypothetical protein